MEFLKEVLGEMYDQVAEKITAYNESNKEDKAKQIKLANLTSGEYVSSFKYADIEKDLKTERESKTAIQKSLEALQSKSGNDEELKTKIEQLNKQLNDEKSNAEKMLTERERDYLINDTLKDNKCRNIKALKSLLDLEKVSVKDGKIEGLDEQLKALKESDGYLFNQEDPAPFKAGFPAGNGDSGNKGITFPKVI